MMLKREAILKQLSDGEEKPDEHLVITPLPKLDKSSEIGAASVDLRLGCWFTSLRKEGVPCLDLSKSSPTSPTLSEKINDPSLMCEELYVNFESEYILHPQSFVLATTLEWVRMPYYLAAYIHGKSSWGRRGLIVATASVIHPGFIGCITLELTNLGEVPIKIRPGIEIAQLCLHETKAESPEKTKSRFSCSRKPTIGSVTIDDFAKKLKQPLRLNDPKL